MPQNEDLLDRNTLAHFKDAFRVMGIGDYQIVTAIQNISLPPLDFDTHEQLSTDGLLAAENFADEWIEIAEPQLYFKYKKHVVIMYQLDQFLTQANYNQRNYRPYHLCFCKALQEAHAKNRYESRYVMTYNTSGKFRVNLFVRDKNSDGTVYTLKKEQDVILPLKVCQHCLREINWKHFRSYCGGGLEWWRGGNAHMRNKIVDEFDLQEYLVTARQDNFFDHPVFGTASSTIRKEYVLSPQIKEALKKIIDYTCEICHEQFPANELHIHHKNHNEGDNRRQNLMVVCADCHALIHEAEGGFVSKKKNRSSTTAVAKESKKISSDAEYAAAQKNLGDMYANSWGVPKDESKAQTFYRKAFNAYKILAAKSDIDAWYELANFYMLGLGVKKDINEAQRRFKNVFSRYKERANNGDIKAKIRLGLMYPKGLGVPQDLYEAKKIVASLRKEVQIVDSEWIELCLLARNFDDTLKFHAKAVQLFEVAANNGDTDAAFELAKLYSYKDFIGKDYDGVVLEDYGDKTANLFKASAKSYEKQSAEYEEQQRIDPATVQKAKAGDVTSILKLKRLAKEGNADAKSVLESLYYDDNKEHAVGTVVLCEGVTSIGDFAFYGCSVLKEIVLPKSLTSIGDFAFRDCSGLKEIVLPEGLTSIGNYAFKDCSGLKEIVLPDGVTSIGAFAFYGCSELKEIVLPDGVTSIGYRAFDGCSSLKEIVLPEGVTSIGIGAFKGCSRLERIALPDGLTSIGNFAFENCSGLSSITYHKKTEPILKKYFGSKWAGLKKIIIDD